MYYHSCLNVCGGASAACALSQRPCLACFCLAFGCLAFWLCVRRFVLPPLCQLCLLCSLFWSDFADRRFSKTSRPKPKANRKRTESDLSINAPRPPRVDFEASGAPIKITLSNSRTANQVQHSVRNLLHGGLRVGHVLLWFDWMQSMSLPLMHEATIRKRMAKLIRMRAVTGIVGRIFLTEQKPKAKMRDC